MRKRERAEAVLKMAVGLIRAAISKNWRPTVMLDYVTVVSNGIDRLCKLYPYQGMDDGRIVDFVVYQVYRYRDYIKTGGKWNLSQCFDDRAAARYRQQFLDTNGKSGVNYYIDLWLSENGLSRKKLEAQIKDERPSHDIERLYYVEAEETIKRRFHNTENGFFLCQSATTGWCPASSACNECVFGERCKCASEKNYPKLIEYRMNYGKK